MENGKNKKGMWQIRETSESGRSLIEMLAVLAIIGVFVVLGLNLYWYTITRQKTNALKAELSTMAVTTSIKLSTSSNFKIHGNLKYPFEGKFNDNQTFTITVSEIPQEICGKLRSENWSLPAETLINGIERGYCHEKNVIAFTFHNSVFDGEHPELEDDSHGGEPFVPTSDPCRPCRKGCPHACIGRNYWAWSDGWECTNGMRNPPYCNKAACSQAVIPITDCDGTSIDCCPDDEDCSQPKCCKADWVEIKDCDGNKTKCCPDDGNVCEDKKESECCEAGWVDIINCNGTTTKCCPRSEGDCAQPSCCSTDWVSVTDCEGNVTDCCPDGGRICVNETSCCDPGTCTGTGNICVNHRCTCPSGYTKDASGNCNACPTTTVFQATNESECNKCSTAEHPYQMKHGLCEPAPSCTNDADCTYMYGFCLEGGTCGCPDEGYFRNENGNCTECTLSASKVTFAEECARCNNRYMYSGKCTLCQDNKIVDITRSSCYDCPTNGEIFRPLNPSDCEKCSNAEYTYQMDGITCRPTKECNKDTDCGQYRHCIDNTCGSCRAGFFQNKNGNCTSCDEKYPKETYADECAKCGDKREMDGKNCVLKK